MTTGPGGLRAGGTGEGCNRLSMYWVIRNISLFPSGATRFFQDACRIQDVTGTIRSAEHGGNFCNVILNIFAAVAVHHGKRL